MGGNDREACGRCSMTAAVDVSQVDDEGRDPFDGASIEVPEDELRTVSKPAIWAGRAKRRLDEIATRLTYGR